MTGTAVDDALELTLINDLGDIAVAAERIDAFCSARGLSPETVFEVNLAVDELVTNTINYGYDDGGEHRIEIALRFEGGTLVVEITDDGRAFDPLQAPEPDLGAPLEERAVGGLGIYLSRKLMDGIAYRREDGRNIVTLMKSAASGDAS